MNFIKYKKEYEKFCKYSHKAYKTLLELYINIIKDKELNNTKELSNIIKDIEYYLDNYASMLINMKNTNFSKIKNKQTKNLNNLITLPVYEDKDIFINIDNNISDIFNPKD